MHPPCDVKALYPYTSEHEDDLNFEVGQVIHVHAKEDDEWLNGSYIKANGDKEVGIFPKSFVELIEAPKAPARPARMSAQKESQATSGEAIQSSTHESPESAQENLAEQPETLISRVKTPDTSGSNDARIVNDDEVEMRNPGPRNLMQESEPWSTSNLASHNETSTTSQTAPVEHEPSVEHVESTNASLPTEESLSNHGKAPKSNAFRDRIAAFNKQGAVPVAPKPMAKPSLAKKPFVAPPPSKDSYVPITTSKAKPPMATEGHMDESTHSQTKVHEEIAHESARSEEPPKVGSLKDRIAALQAERNQIAAKKTIRETETPSKSSLEPMHDQSDQHSQSDLEHEQSSLRKTEPHAHLPDEDELSRISSTETTNTHPRPIIPVMPHEEYSETPRSPSLLSRQQTNNSIDSIHPQQTGASVQSHNSALKPPAIPVMPIQKFQPVGQNTHVEESRSDHEEDIQSGSSQVQDRTEAVDQDGTAAAESSEDELDEEELRKQQLRARMAKMSGGMGMGMHMALGIGGPPNNNSRSAKPKASKTNSIPRQEADEEHQAPIPMPGLPPLPQVAAVVEAVDNSPSSEHAEQSHTNVVIETHRSYTLEPSSMQADISRSEKTQTSEAAAKLTEDLDKSTANLSLNDVDIHTTCPTDRAIDDSQPLSPIRAIPPPIPGGRPISAHVQPQQMIATDRPEQEALRIDTPTSPTTHAPQVNPLPRDPYQVPSAEFSRSPPSVPTTYKTTRTSMDSTGLPAQSPQYTPGGSKRMSYFGSTSNTSYRPSMDSDARESLDYPRSSFDAVSRTNSARTDAPARPPPPPSIPTGRAPPPPVPNTAPPSRLPAPPPSRMVSIPEPSFAADQDEVMPHLEAPGHVQPNSVLSNTAAVESEREGYEADDDETDVQSLNRASTSGQRPQQVTESTSQSAAALERSSTKKKGIKGLFKRKDK